MADLGGIAVLEANARAPINRELICERAGRHMSSVPRPFLRWAGSKQRLLSQLAPLLPRDYRCYYEPFAGSASLFFLLEPANAIISDASRELMATYQAVREAPAEVLRLLGHLDVSNRDQYYAIRANRATDPVERASEFIYLNRAGWNGLYRVNSRGEFNVPYGAPKTTHPIDAENVFACADLLRKPGVELRDGDFDEAVATASAGDFVFFDPPYVTSHNNNGFIDYNERLFSWADQERLAETARRLAGIGVRVMVANAHHERVIELYRGFSITPVTRHSTLAGGAASRRSVTESIFCSHETSDRERSL